MKKMVSTRQMSTTVSSNGEDSCGRIASVTRHTSGAICGPTFPLQQASTQLSEETYTKPRIFLLDLPIEILDSIFSYVGYKKVGQIRVVSQQMNQICSAILNSTFSKLQTQMLNRFQAVKAKMPRRESARRNHPLACECDIIETCYMRLSLLQMTFGKHIERKHCCFFPGGILDEVYNVLYSIRNTQRLERPFKVTDELFDLSTMAMEYFKDHIEPNLPEIAYFSKDFFDLTSKNKQTYSLKAKSELADSSSSMPSPPQSNMVLRKGIRKIKQGMKMYNNQLTVLRSELRSCKRKSSEQGKQIAEQQKLLAEQQKQTLEYANRLDENDKKNEEISRKFSTLLQELNKCKTELQYWRSKSPATQICSSCGQKVVPVAPEEFQALVNQGVKPEDISINIDDLSESESNTIISENSTNLQATTELVVYPTDINILKTGKTVTNNTTLNCHAGLKRRLEPIDRPVTTEEDGKLVTVSRNVAMPTSSEKSDVYLGEVTISRTTEVTVGCSDGGSEYNGNNVNFIRPSTSCTSSDTIPFHNISNDTKKARRVQNKGSRCHNIISKRSK